MRKNTEEELMIYGRHPVQEALKSSQSVEKIFIQESADDYALRDILRLAAGAPGVSIKMTDKKNLDRICPGGRHQGVVAFLAAVPYAEIEDILEKAARLGEDPFVIVLDGIEDPHNLGAIVRSANAAGVHGVITRSDRASGLSSAAYKASAGALSYTLVARVTNISRTIKYLKDRGLWCVCADMDGDDMYTLDLGGPVCLVIGNEGRGVSDLVKKNCDFRASIPMRGEISSLNASVAAAVLAYEIARQRSLKIL